MKVDDSGNIVDPYCRYATWEVEQHIAKNKISRPVEKDAVSRHAEACEEIWETRQEQRQKQLEEFGKNLEREEAQQKIETERKAREAAEERELRDRKKMQCQNRCLTLPCEEVCVGYFWEPRNCVIRCPEQVRCMWGC